MPSIYLLLYLFIHGDRRKNGAVSLFNTVISPILMNFPFILNFAENAHKVTTKDNALKPYLKIIGTQKRQLYI